MEEDQVEENVSKLDIEKSMGPGAIHLQMMRELVDVIVRPLRITFE